MKNKKKIIGIVCAVFVFTIACTIALMGADSIKSKASNVDYSTSQSGIDADSVPASTGLPTDHCVFSEVPALIEHRTDVYFEVPESWGDDISVNVSQINPLTTLCVHCGTDVSRMLLAGIEIQQLTLKYFGEMIPDVTTIEFTDGVNTSGEFLYRENGMYSLDGYIGDFDSQQFPVGTGSFIVYCKSDSSSLTAHYSLNYTSGYDFVPETRDCELTENKCYDGFYKGILSYPVYPIESINIYFTDADGNTIKPTGKDNFVIDFEDASVCTFANNKMINGSPDDLPEETSVKIFYKTDWKTANIHYKGNDGKWTTAPGVKMSDSVYPGYKTIELDAKETDSIVCCFNDNNGNWDNNSQKDYSLSKSNVYTIENGKLYTVTPDNMPNNNITVYYYTGWTTPYVHYKTNSTSWTTAPGVAMSSSDFSGYATITIPMGNDDTLTACFNNGSGNWDSNSGSNYTLSGSDVFTIKNGKIREGVPTYNTVTIQYSNSNNWDNVNIHYQIGSNEWTSVPGIAMTESHLDNIYTKTIDLGDSDSIKFCFNNGSSWDNNNGNDYKVTGNGIYYVYNNTVTPITFNN